jgi:hypothetical protein
MGFKDFLGKLQNADESVKKRWLVALSAVSMLVIIVVWLKYFAFLTRPAGSLGQERAGSDFSFWETMKTGLAVLWDELLAALRGVGRILGASRNYIIKP